MTGSNVIELIVLGLSLVAAFIIVRSSNRKVADLDGLGSIVKKEDCNGKVIAHI